MSERTLAVSLMVIIAALLIVGSGFIYYVGAYQPAQLHAQATATVVAAVTGTAHTNATGTAQTHATVQVQTSATASTKAQATSVVVATQIALQDIYNQATSGTPAIKDSLGAQDSQNWDEGQYTDNSGNFLGSCGFSGGAYSGEIVSGRLLSCSAQATNYSNLAFQVEITVISGHSGGLVIRSDSVGSGYHFRISTDGTYIFKKYFVDNNNTAIETALVSGNTPAITQGTNQPNTLAIVARGSTFYLYINQQYVNQVTDNTYKSGRVGVFVDSDAGGAKSQFRNAVVWKL
jgi:hypothetical protein